MRAQSRRFFSGLLQRGSYLVDTSLAAPPGVFGPESLATIHLTLFPIGEPPLTGHGGRRINYLICGKRDRIWEAYTQALKAYIRAIDALGQLHYAEPGWAEVENARKAVETSRSGLRNHCSEHGCDPDLLTVFDENQVSR